MAKQLKIKITNEQIAKKVNLDHLKQKFAKGKEAEAEEKAPQKEEAPNEEGTQPPRKIRAKTKSSFGHEQDSPQTVPIEPELPLVEEQFVEAIEVAPAEIVEEKQEKEKEPIIEEPIASTPPPAAPPQPATTEGKEPIKPAIKKEVLGPTGRHISDLLPPKKKPTPPQHDRGMGNRPPRAAHPGGQGGQQRTPYQGNAPRGTSPGGDRGPRSNPSGSGYNAPRSNTPGAGHRAPPPPRAGYPKTPLPPPSFPTDVEDHHKKGKKTRDFKDIKPQKRETRPTVKDRKEGSGEEETWRRKRPQKQTKKFTEEVVRPTELHIRMPITIKDLSAQMKLKSSELIQKLFMQGIILTLNDLLDDETTVQFLGDEFGCKITIDTSEEERIQITPKSIAEEIRDANPNDLKIRPPVVTFMGHVDHGKTSLIDAIRSSNKVASEAGAITQHIGAFQCTTKVGALTILDTPGHEAFSAMRARGASTTDIVVLVIAGDEGMREQTKEAITHAKQAGVTIVVAINKCDKPNFNADNIYRELAEVDLLPESWGGTTITVNTSAVTKKGIPELLEMLALQSEVLELKANPNTRARGVVIESEMHKGMGSIATLLVQNGTLHFGDALVFERHYGRVKTLQDDLGNNLKSAGPSTPIEVTGLSGNPAAGDPFIVVKSEKEARSIIEARAVGREQNALKMKKPTSLDHLMEKEGPQKKILKLILRADVQGSLEALKSSLLRIKSEKASIEIIFMGIGEITESDVQWAQASNAVILGFHTAIESHVESLVKEHGVTIRLYDVIYHAIDEVKALMTGLLDKIAEEKITGTAFVQATFKASQLGVIAGCMVNEGTITRNSLIRVIRNKETVWQGKIASLKRNKEDVKEVKKGFECGILLAGFNAVQAEDTLQAYEIIYLTQQL